MRDWTPLSKNVKDRPGGFHPSSGAISFADLTPAHVESIYPRLRHGDRVEAELSGWTSAAHASDKIAELSTLSLTCLVDGKPAAILGVSDTGTVATAWFLGSALVDQYPIALHGCALGLIHFIKHEFPGRVIRAEVWSGYATAIRWLKRLGFVAISPGVAPSAFGLASGKYQEIIIMELPKAIWDQ